MIHKEKITPYNNGWESGGHTNNHLILSITLNLDNLPVPNHI